MPTPAVAKSGRCSSTVESRPLRASARASARPPMPPPAIRIGAGMAVAVWRAGSGRSSLRAHQAALRRSLVGGQAGVVQVKGRAIGAEDLAVGAHVQIDVRVVVRRARAHALELLHADGDFLDALIVGEM